MLDKYISIHTVPLPATCSNFSSKWQALCKLTLQQKHSLQKLLHRYVTGYGGSATDPPSAQAQPEVTHLPRAKRKQSELQRDPLFRKDWSAPHAQPISSQNESLTLTSDSSGGPYSSEESHKTWFSSSLKGEPSLSVKSTLYGRPPHFKRPAKWGQKTTRVGRRPGQSHDQTNWPFSPEPVCARASALKWPFCKASSAQPLNRKPAASACGALAPGKFGLFCLYIYLLQRHSDGI